MIKTKINREMMREYNMTTDERLKESYKRMRRAKVKDVLAGELEKIRKLKKKNK